MAGQVAVITGAAGGIGQALARALVRDGARIALLDLDEGRLQELADTLVRAGGECLVHRCDVTEPADCQAAIDAVEARWGGVDLVLANAGISHRSLFSETDPAVLRRVMEVNFFGAVNIVRAALPSVTQRRGQLVATSSVAGFAPLVGRTGYAASKHALHGFFDSLRSELRGTGVGVLLICPGFTDTALARTALTGDGGAVGDGTRQATGRTMSPDEVAEGVLQALRRRRRLALISPIARASFWLSRVAPSVYERLMLRGQGGEFRAGLSA